MNDDASLHSHNQSLVLLKRFTMMLPIEVAMTLSLMMMLLVIAAGDNGDAP